MYSHFIEICKYSLTFIDIVACNKILRDSSEGTVNTGPYTCNKILRDSSKGTVNTGPGGAINRGDKFFFFQCIGHHVNLNFIFLRDRLAVSVE
jgi:hypothetical protein